ncbi:MAG: asparagine synthase (glutamine-hydrolyzing) [Fibrobacter sp.]|jgi:asparagine synthase (glutamine-hydrolysing)|nr:asparagine synthase (glutamine-hydrolyzing) [Fibrobacter sp.]
MCGITGIFHPDPLFPIPSSILHRMSRILNHRGPDDEGYYIGEGVGLGQQRLSIIDLAGGKQPVQNENGKLQVIFNGEIFNYIELTASLKSRGHRFSTRSDTEVLVHLYEDFGEKFVEHLNGQFAIALWDSEKRELILARDRVGIRPLFYTRLSDGVFLFGSEIKSIFAYPGITPQFDPLGLEQVFSLWVPVPPRTVFSGVKELLPGHILRVSADGEQLRRYWRLEFPDRGGYERRSFDFYQKRLEELLYDAVRIRLRADVPVAAYLSGGLDSSIISTLVKKHHNSNLITFSISFKDHRFDETSFQQAMVGFLGTDHRSIEIGYDSIGRLFPEVVWFSEIPMIRTAPAPLLALAELVRKNDIKVVLTGEGADEMFGGYNIFKENKIRRFWARFPDSRIRPLLLLDLYPYITPGEQKNRFWQLFFRKGLTDTSNPCYSHLLRWVNTSRIKRFFTEQYRSAFDEQQNVMEQVVSFMDPEIFRWDPLCQAQYLEISLFMSGYLLSSQGDRMMMGRSVEGRFPFLDYRVIEFAATVPPEYKLNGMNEKYILKKTYGSQIPESVVKRSKQPYRAPVSQCFVSDSDSLPSRVISPSSIAQAGIFDPQRVSLLLEKVKSNPGQISAVDDMAVAAIDSTQLLYHYFISELT